MTLSEYLATGARYCECKNVAFRVEPYFIKQYRQRHRDSFTNLVANVILGEEEIKPRKVYNARCSQCNKLYLCSRTLKVLKENIKQSNIEIAEIVK